MLAKGRSLPRFTTLQATHCARAAMNTEPSPGAPAVADGSTFRSCATPTRSTAWLVVTKLDVLDERDEIPVCTGYEIHGKVTDEIPADVYGLEAIKPRYTVLKGWRESTEGITEYEKLPKAAREYLAFQERESGAKIGMISTGPDRDQTIVLPRFAEALNSLNS